MNITDIIALIALIVAFYGAVLSSFLYYKELLHIKLICLDKNYFSFSKKNQVCDKEGFCYWCYNEKLYSLAIHVQIRNNSKINTTINSFILNNKYIIDSSSNIDSRFSTGFYKENTYIFDNSIKNIKPLIPLISLNSYETIEGYLVFNNVTELPSILKLTVDTVQKNKNFKLKTTIIDCRKIS